MKTRVSQSRDRFGGQRKNFWQKQGWCETNKGLGSRNRGQNEFWGKIGRQRQGRVCENRIWGRSKILGDERMF